MASEPSRSPSTTRPFGLVPALRRLFSSEDVALLDWHQGAPAGLAGQTQALVTRLAGSASVAGDVRSWTLVRKRIPRPDPDDEGSAWRLELRSNQYWKREFHIYTSGLLGALPAGFAAPRCLGAEEDADGCTVWLEEIHAELPTWPLDRYRIAAQHLGLHNGQYLTGRRLPDHPWLSLAIQQHRERANRGFFDHMDELRQHPIVRRGFPDDVAAGLMRTWRERETFYAMLRRLPQVFQHGDAGRRNLMSRTAPDGEIETVAIDWGFAGVGAVGEEIGSTVVSAAIWGQIDPSRLPEMDALVFDGYLQGLREAGWRGDAVLPRLGYLCDVALRYGPNMAFVDAQSRDPVVRKAWERRLGVSIEQLADLIARVRRFSIRCADEARQLMGSIRNPSLRQC